MTAAISILGTGRMGSALARALLKEGHRTTVWNRTRHKAEPLAAMGAVVAGSVETAIDAADIVVVNVSNYTASKALLHPADVAQKLRGKLIIELTSGTPHGAREAFHWAKNKQAEYLDGAILATPDFIGTESGTILFAGPRAAFDATSPILTALGGNIQHVGDDPGTANALDSALLSYMWGALFGTLHAIAVCQAEGIGLGELGRLSAATAPVIEGLVADLIQRTKEGRLAADEHTLSSISAHHDALQHLLEVSEERGIDRTPAIAYDAIFRRAIAAGHLHDDFAVLTQHMRQPS